jgi:hypothetical protein
MVAGVKLAGGSQLDGLTDKESGNFDGLLDAQHPQTSKTSLFALGRCLNKLKGRRTRKVSAGRERISLFTADRKPCCALDLTQQELDLLRYTIDRRLPCARQLEIAAVEHGCVGRRDRDDVNPSVGRMIVSN